MLAKARPELTNAKEGKGINLGSESGKPVFHLTKKRARGKKKKRRKMRAPGNNQFVRTGRRTVEGDDLSTSARSWEKKLPSEKKSKGGGQDTDPGLLGENKNVLSLPGEKGIPATCTIKGEEFEPRGKEWGKGVILAHGAPGADGESTKERKKQTCITAGEGDPAHMTEITHRRKKRGNVTPTRKAGNSCFLKKGKKEATKNQNDRGCRQEEGVRSRESITEERVWTEEEK